MNTKERNIASCWIGLADNVGQTPSETCKLQMVSKRLGRATFHGEGEMNNSGRVAVIVVALIALPLLYVLSSGPAVALMNAEVLPYGVFDTIYWPLNRLYDHNHTARQFFDWYDNIWLRLFGMPVVPS